MNKTAAVNLVGLVVMICAVYGVDVTPEQQTQLAGLMGGIGCVINLAVAMWTKRQKDTPKS